MQSFSFFFLFVMGGGGDFGSGSGSKFNCAARVGSVQTISGTGRVRASVLSPCRPLSPGKTPLMTTVAKFLDTSVCGALDALTPASVHSL